ncbi:MAG: hypothetical protein ACRDRU_24950 [Pseudonocardiaceae bacterium]
MTRGWRVRVTKSCYVLGVVNLILLLLGKLPMLTIGLAPVLVPCTLFMALKLTTFLACNMISFALGHRDERAELLVGAISALQPPSAGEDYQEAMLAEIRAAPADQVRAIATNLLVTAPGTILAAWARIPRTRWKRPAGH